MNVFDDFHMQQQTLKMKTVDANEKKSQNDDKHPINQDIIISQIEPQFVCQDKEQFELMQELERRWKHHINSVDSTTNRPDHNNSPLHVQVCAWKWNSRADSLYHFPEFITTFRSIINCSSNKNKEKDHNHQHQQNERIVVVVIGLLLPGFMDIIVSSLCEEESMKTGKNFLLFHWPITHTHELDCTFHMIGCSKPSDIHVFPIQEFIRLLCEYKPNKHTTHKQINFETEVKALPFMEVETMYFYEEYTKEAQLNIEHSMNLLTKQLNLSWADMWPVWIRRTAERNLRMAEPVKRMKDILLSEDHNKTNTVKTKTDIEKQNKQREKKQTMDRCADEWGVSLPTNMFANNKEQTTTPNKQQEEEHDTDKLQLFEISLTSSKLHPLSWVQQWIQRGKHVSLHDDTSVPATYSQSVRERFGRLVSFRGDQVDTMNNTAESESLDAIERDQAREEEEQIEEVFV